MPLHRSAHDLRERLRTALPRAVRNRDDVTVAALRSTLAALDNAEAVSADPHVHRAGALEAAPRGAGAAEVPRRPLSGAEVVGVVRAEIDDRHAAADAYAAVGEHERAARLRAEADVLDDHLTSSAGRNPA